MEKKETINIRIEGKYGEHKLNPDLYDIRDIKSLIENIEVMLFPKGKKSRPIISYRILEGSVVHQFQTSRQTVVGFDAVLSDMQKHGTLDILEQRTANAFENLQKKASQNDYSFSVTTSVSKSNNPIVVSPQTNWHRTEDTWVETEVYFYGKLIQAGGKQRGTIRLDTEKYGPITIETDQEVLKEQEENLLYRFFGVRAMGKQHISSGEIDTHTLRLIELKDINKKWDEDYLNQLIERSSGNWEGIDPDAWQRKIRGDYEL